MVCGLTLAGLVACEQPPVLPQDCSPTPFDEIGPFYRPGAPIRASVGEGFVLGGQVLSATGCRPLPGSRVEFWLVNLQGEYDDAHRATVIVGTDGRYRFESNPPTDYVNRQPHIHIKVSAEGHEELITQYYPKADEAEARFDLVLAVKQQGSPAQGRGGGS